jgi:very-short-patch-repair endonuclease
MQAVRVIAPSVDRTIADLAGGQYGVVSRDQIRVHGISDDAIDRRLASGRLHAVHRGGYAVGHRELGPGGRFIAAVLACGPGAVLSHGSAAALWDLRRRDASVIDVSVPTAGGRSRAGLRIHRVPSLQADDGDVHRGIPVTSPARTILDLAAILDERGLERALDRAELLELTDYPTLDALARSRPGHHGAGKLTRALQSHHAGTTLTKSELEELFLALCRRHGLPRPLVNTWVEGKEVDFLFAEHRLIVETDSWTHHRSREAFETDRARDALLARAGYRTLRFTYRQIEREPASVAQTVAAMLASS